MEKEIEVCTWSSLSTHTSLPSAHVVFSKLGRTSRQNAFKWWIEIVKLSPSQDSFFNKFFRVRVPSQSTGIHVEGFWNMHKRPCTEPPDFIEMTGYPSSRKQRPHSRYEGTSGPVGCCKP